MKKRRSVKKRTEKEMAKERRGIYGVKPKKEDRKETKVLECEKKMFKNIKEKKRW